MRTKHLIETHQFEVTIPASENAYRFQQRLSDFYWNSLVPQMAALFDEIIPPQTIVRIDTMVIEIPDITLNNWNEHVIIQEILSRLKDKLEIIVSANKSHNINEVEFNEKFKKQSLREYHFELWLYWLEYGSLPAYTSSPDSLWIKSVLETLALEHTTITRLKKLVVDKPYTLYRLVLQHKRETLKSIIELFTTYNQQNLSGFLTELEKKFTELPVSSAKPDFREFEKPFWISILTEAIIKSNKKTSQELITIAVNTHDVHNFLNKNKGLLSKTPLESFVNDKFILNLNKAQLKIPEEEALLSTDFSETHKNDFSMIETPQYFTNAGMILCHPFLQRLFNTLGLLKKNDFINHKSISKACLLLHYLVTGEEAAPEYEMILPKFLCGIPVNIPLDYHIKLKKEEKEEVYHMLQAVIDHWNYLGKTSPEGLREGFLQREGKLLKDQSGWKMYVEQKAQDVLLDKLPWNINLIKLPWMDELLKVEWR